MQGTYQTEKSKKWKRESIALAMVLLSCIVSLSTATAQESVNSTGSNATGSGGTVSYSVGQVVYQTYTGTNGSVAEGVQQPYEISVLTGTENVGIHLNVSTYPNPTSNYLVLNIYNTEESLNFFSVNERKMHYQLFNSNGSLLQFKAIADNETSIQMHRYVAGTYILRILLEMQPFKEFKIVKM